MWQRRLSHSDVQNKEFGEFNEDDVSSGAVGAILGISLTADRVRHWHNLLQGWQRLHPNIANSQWATKKCCWCQGSEVKMCLLLLPFSSIYVHMYPLLPRSRNSKAADLIAFLFRWCCLCRGFQKELTTEPWMMLGLDSLLRCGLKICCDWLYAFHFAQISHSFMHQHHNPLTRPLSLGQEWFYSYINTSVSGTGVTRLEMSPNLTHN